ncbi:hypothetical protein C8R47DRAFT_1206732 [Mycena vitilis]|nr:hypothetical protein C8R47DRAFT_1206732 [Mycena vitilis]
MHIVCIDAADLHFVCRRWGSNPALWTMPPLLLPNPPPHGWGTGGGWGDAAANGGWGDNDGLGWGSAWGSAPQSPDNAGSVTTTATQVAHHNGEGVESAWPHQRTNGERLEHAWAESAPPPRSWEDLGRPALAPESVQSAWAAFFSTPPHHQLPPSPRFWDELWS